MSRLAWLSMLVATAGLLAALGSSSIALAQTGGYPPVPHGLWPPGGAPRGNPGGTAPPQMGFYFSLGLLIPVLLIFLLWVRTSHWVSEDTQTLKGNWTVWNQTVFFCGLAGLLLVWVIPNGLVGFAVLLIGYGLPTACYVFQRNQMVPDSEKVLTWNHIQKTLARWGLRIGGRKRLAEQEGPPIRFIGKSMMQSSEDPNRVHAAERSPGYLAAKELVYDAILRRSTDIHLEPRRDHMAVRYRIDGILQEAEPFERHTGAAVLNVFKVLGNLDIAEKRRPQDGSFGAIMQRREIDFRVASQGTVEGEKLSLRILDKSKTVQSLSAAGMRDKMVEQVRSIITQPQGMLICCGPTGAGKSTTLNACLLEIDRYQRQCYSIEDPIEYQVDNVNQVEINTKAGQTFATALRSILRQDPDVILVGEIRDEETAQIACRAGQTGHLVLTTLHANDTITALYRMLDLKVNPIMLAEAVSCILAQRLVRRLCNDCKEPYKPKPEFLKKANLPPAKIDTFYRPPKNAEQVCPKCGGAGYFGRIGVFELLMITDRMREMIASGAPARALKDEARKNNMLYLQEEGLRLVIRGVTSVEELVRVVK